MEVLIELSILLRFGEKNDQHVKKIIATNKKIKSVVLDPDSATSDIDVENNTWPKEESLSEFDQFKSKTNR
jgi:hypothetical protein